MTGTGGQVLLGEWSVVVEVSPDTSDEHADELSAVLTEALRSWVVIA